MSHRAPPAPSAAAIAQQINVIGDGAVRYARWADCAPLSQLCGPGPPFVCRRRGAVDSQKDWAASDQGRRNGVTLTRNRERGPRHRMRNKDPVDDHRRRPAAGFCRPEVCSQHVSRIVGVVAADPWGRCRLGQLGEVTPGALAPRHARVDDVGRAKVHDGQHPK